MGCKVIMVNRKQEQGDAAIASIKENVKKEKGTDAQIEWRGCDLGKLSTVKETFTKLANELERLDLVSRAYLSCQASSCSDSESSVYTGADVP